MNTTASLHYLKYTQPMIAYCARVAKAKRVPLTFTDTPLTLNGASTMALTFQNENDVIGKKRIVINRNLEDAVKAFVLAHELAHCFDPVLINNPNIADIHREECEGVADYVGWRMCDHFGVSPFLGEDFFYQRIDEQMKRIGRTADEFLRNTKFIDRCDRVLYRLLPPDGAEALKLERSKQPGFEKSGEAVNKDITNYLFKRRRFQR